LDAEEVEFDALPVPEAEPPVPPEDDGEVLPVEPDVPDPPVGVEPEADGDDSAAASASAYVVSSVATVC